ncbi:MAG TPA: 2-dehydropantoate 2-reductase [bacterium]
MRVLVFGAGAIGSVLGGLLGQAGHDVVLLGRRRLLATVERDGLRIEGLWGSHHVRGLSAVSGVGELAGAGPPDWVFVCVKAYQTADAARALAPVLARDTLVCAFQNGLGNYEALTAKMPAERVALGRVIFGAEIEPGRARVTVSAGDVLVGWPGASGPPARLEALARALSEAGIACRTDGNIVAALWAKVLYNCALNGLSTVLEVPYGRLPEHPVAPGLMRAVIEEAYRVAASQGVRLEPPAAAGYLEALFGRLIPDTAAHRPSMLQNVLRGSPTEIDALNGALVRLGEQAGVTVPANALITRLVHEKERFLGVQPATSDERPATR